MVTLQKALETRELNSKGDTMGSMITSRPKHRQIDSGKYSLNKQEEPSTHKVIIERSYTGSEYREHLDSQKTRGNPSWEKESASLNKHRKQ